MKPVVKARPRIAGATQNNLKAAGDVEEFQGCRNQDMFERQAGDDAMFDGEVWQEHSKGGRGWKEQMKQGQEEENKEIGQKVMTKARGSLNNNSIQEGALNTEEAAILERDGEVEKDGFLSHGIRGMKDFGKWPPRLNRREDFDIKDIEEFTLSFNNFGI